MSTPEDRARDGDRDRLFIFTDGLLEAEPIWRGRCYAGLKPRGRHDALCYKALSSQRYDRLCKEVRQGTASITAVGRFRLMLFLPEVALAGDRL
jgi:hypothetical protein